MDVTTFINYLLALFGIIVSIYAYLQSKEVKDPRCYYSTYRDIVKLTKKNDDIRLYFRTNEVDRVFTTYLWFWNKGRKPILKSDIPEKSKIALQLSDPSNEFQVLDSRIIKTTRSETDFSIHTTSQNLIEIQFEFLDRNDGVVIEVQHTGSYKTIVESRGIILGANKGIQVKGYDNKSSLSKHDERPRPYRIARQSERISLFMFALFWIAFSGYLFSSSRFPNQNSTSLQIQTTQQLEDILIDALPSIEPSTLESIIDKSGEVGSWENGVVLLISVVVGIGGMMAIPWIIWFDRMPFPPTLHFDLREQSNSTVERKP